MTVFDYGILVILISSILLSLWRGFMSEVLSLLGWGLAFGAAIMWSEEVAQMLPVPIPSRIRHGIAFLTILLVISFLMGIISWGILRSTEKIRLSMGDRGLGGLFGLARGVLLIISLSIALSMLGLTRHSVWRKAVFTPILDGTLQTIKPWLPDAISKRMLH